MLAVESMFQRKCILYFLAYGFLCFGNNLAEVCFAITFLTKRGKPLWRHYFQDCDALILVVDSNDHERMPILADDLAWMLADKTLQIKCMLVFANKQDLKNAAKVDQVEQVLKLSTYDKSVLPSYAVMPCVATTGEGLQQGFEFLAKELKKEQQ